MGKKLTYMTSAQLDQARRLLCRLQDAIRDSVRAAQPIDVAQGRRGDARRMTRVAAVTSADTIYGIDKVSEAVVLAWFAAEATVRGSPAWETSAGSRRGCG